MDLGGRIICANRVGNRYRYEETAVNMCTAMTLPSESVPFQYDMSSYVPPSEI